MVCTSCVVLGDVANTGSTARYVSLEQVIFSAENFSVKLCVLVLECCDVGRDVFSSEQQGSRACLVGSFAAFCSASVAALLVCCDLGEALPLFELCLRR